MTRNAERRRLVKVIGGVPLIGTGWSGSSTLYPVVTFKTPEAALGDVLGRKESHHYDIWAITFLIIAIIAAVLGFGGIAGTAVELRRYCSSYSSCCSLFPC
jgi:hypothetical protein